LGSLNLLYYQPLTLSVVHLSWEDDSGNLIQMFDQTLLYLLKEKQET